MTTIEHVRLKMLIMPASHALTIPISRVEAACFAQPWAWREIGSFLGFVGVLPRVDIQEGNPPLPRLEHHAWAALVGGRVVGHLLAMIRDDVAQIYRLAVEPEQRGRRLAARLLGKLESVASSRRVAATAIVLRESNLAAQVWFRERGYLAPRHEPIAHGVFEDGENGITMVKPANGSDVVNRVHFPE